MKMSLKSGLDAKHRKAAQVLAPTEFDFSRSVKLLFVSYTIEPVFRYIA
jgi:hypothetical protein